MHAYIIIQCLFVPAVYKTRCNTYKQRRHALHILCSCEYKKTLCCCKRNKCEKYLVFYNELQSKTKRKQIVNELQ